MFLRDTARAPCTRCIREGSKLMLQGSNRGVCVADRFSGGGAGGDRRLPLTSGQHAHLQAGGEAHDARTVRPCYCSDNDDVIVVMMMMMMVIFIIIIYYCWTLFICV